MKLTKSLFVVSALLLACFSSVVVGQGSDPVSNGGVAPFVNPSFTEIPSPSMDPEGQCPSNWACSNLGVTATVVNTAPYSVAIPAHTVASLSQDLNLYELGEDLTVTFYLRFFIGQTTNVSGNLVFVTATYDGDSLHSTSHSPTTDTSVPPNDQGFSLWTVHFTANNLRPSTTVGTLTLTFETPDGNRPNNDNHYYIDDVTITGDAIIVGDPQFVGLRGQSYQVHGVDGEIYNLVSSANTQVNSRFVFLSQGECPIFNGIPAKNCWSHPGSYLGQIGIQQVVNGKAHQLSIVAGRSKKGFASVELNGKAFNVGSSFADTNAFAVSYNSTHTIRVQTEEFVFTFENSDMFVNQAVSARIPLSQIQAHGLFGQTHEKKIYSSAIKYIAGEVDDYVIGENSLFGNDFVYNQFQL